MLEIVRVTYQDPRFEAVEGDLEEPGEFEVVGWRLPERWRGWCSVASEIGPDQRRAITHVPIACIVEEVILRVELEDPPHLSEAS